MSADREASPDLSTAFFGAGGGMIVVPLLILLVRLEDKKRVFVGHQHHSAADDRLARDLREKRRVGLKTALPIFWAARVAGILAGLWFKKVSRDFYIALVLLILFGGARLILC